MSLQAVVKKGMRKTHAVDDSSVMNILKYIVFLLVICISACHRPEKSKEFSGNTPQNKMENYEDLKKRILATKDSFRVKYNSADRSGQRLIVDSARQFIFGAITRDIFPQWFGTPWEFYGQSRTPRKGSIACGFFVTGVLSDAGFEIPRVKWAQQASEVFIVKLSRDVKRFSNRPIGEVTEYIKKRSNGLYVVGLDCHTGFIYKNNDSVRFVHANYYQPERGVMAEELDSWNPLRYSKYRVLGRILDDSMVISWIKKQRIE